MKLKKKEECHIFFLFFSLICGKKKRKK